MVVEYPLMVVFALRLTNLAATNYSKKDNWAHIEKKKGIPCLLKGKVCLCEIIESTY